VAGAHEQAGLVGRHRDERVVAAQLAVGEPDGLDEVAGVVARDQVGDHLGVGLGGELRAGGHEPIVELHVVLDDAVQDDVDAIARVEVRMRVLLGHAPVRGPARVTDAGVGLRGGRGDATGAVGRRGRAHGLTQEGEVADGAHGVDPVALEHGHAGRVVAAVFELLEAGEQQLARGPAAYVSDDAAHSGPPSARKRPKTTESPFAGALGRPCLEGEVSSGTATRARARPSRRAA
jgi:hypothetical protein